MPNNTYDQSLHSLKQANTRVQSIISNARGQQEVDNGDPWQAAYELVFGMSRKIADDLQDLGQRLDYYDPDTTYEEDVVAYADALNDKVAQLSALLDGPDNGL